uniref:Fungal_trans domain-containing protein n=1 Tax=Heterorhabditis bacteriophora TaxID=37862 RepID=A0A1I7XDC0_HETBA
MLPNEAFQKLLYDLFCLWHSVQRHYDPPLPDTEEQRMVKVGWINEGGRKRENRMTSDKYALLIISFTALTLRIIDIKHDPLVFVKFSRVFIIQTSLLRDYLPFPGIYDDPDYDSLKSKMAHTMLDLHTLYRTMNHTVFHTQEDVEGFRMQLQQFGEQTLVPCIDHFKTFCNKNCVTRWRSVRAAQINRMRDFRPLPDEPITDLVAFYSQMMYVLAVLGARLQGFRYDLTMNKKVFGSFDPVLPLSEAVFSALELLMSDCVLATEPSTSAILVTNNLFSMNCGALARGVVFKDFDIQVVSEETAEHIQSDMNRQRLLQQPAPISLAPSAALLAMKPTSGTKRSNAASNGDRLYSDSANNTAHKKSDVNSKESVTIYPIYNSKNRYWAATYPHLLCTTRQKGRQSTHNSFQDLSPAGQQIDKANGKRPIFYFHIRATMFSPSGRFATAHTLSLPFTIATRRNQVQRMMSSYTATIFWLYGCNHQDGLLLQWMDTGM